MLVVIALFSDYFGIDSSVLDDFGALNLCLASDLPLFIDPFLLFSSDKPEYKALHEKIVNHLIFLKSLAIGENNLSHESLFHFPEVKQSWLGVSKYGNKGRGLGRKFAKNLILAFNGFYANFGEETISSATHIEKLSLVGKGIGRDFISDFTTNLIKEYLLEYTQEFAKKHLLESQLKEFSVRCVFDNKLQTWLPKKFILPYFFLEDGDFILLSPIDILTKDDAFICSSDLTNTFRKIANSLDNVTLRNAVNNFFQKSLPISPTKEEYERAVSATISKFPKILDYYIKFKEINKDVAHPDAEKKRHEIVDKMIPMLKEFCEIMAQKEPVFFSTKPNSYSEALKRAYFLKSVIEENDGYKIFRANGKTASEETIQKIFRLTWFLSPFDVNAEVNNGRGPADYKISFGASDSSIVEFKLAKSSSIKRNLEKQVEIYKKASKSIADIKVILCYTEFEVAKIKNMVSRITKSKTIPENVVIIDASPKISASKA